MGPVSAVVVYILVWWVLLFCILPIGNPRHYDETAQLGNASSAPPKPRLRLKLLINTVLSFIVLGIVQLVLVYAPLGEWVEKWAL